MRTRIIPAQITTVEDKIAGSLNLTQILLLMVPIFWTTIVFVIFPAKLHLSLYKFPLVLVVLVVFLLLSARIKGKVVFDWLFIFARYNTRAKYYVFNKNDSYQREISLPVIEKRQSKLLKKAKNFARRQATLTTQQLRTRDLVKLEQMLSDPKTVFSLKSDTKGGIHVSFEQVKS